MVLFPFVILMEITLCICRRDFINCDQFLQSGGFILFDDSDFPGVSQVVKEVESLGNYELIIRNPNYLFKKN